jgi:hypothetical protein
MNDKLAAFFKYSVYLRNEAFITFKMFFNLLDDTLDFFTIQTNLTDKLSALNKNDTGNLFTATFNPNGKIVYSGTDHASRTKKPTTIGPVIANTIAYQLTDVLRVVIDSKNIQYLLKLLADAKGNNNELSASENDALGYFFYELKDQVISICYKLYYINIFILKSNI